ncbi:UNVERIFIED_CONTAM: DNA-directed RNA polymerase II subunit [Sesamum radiatum]|uniref:DNA-directed RNA polymerase n=1 Tax=Sesamum radiatum TaxID=300843 RepID=A0AAW2IV02_SESRA
MISAYFEEKGLVRQQLDSFDEFIQNTMQEIVDESADTEIQPGSQHNPGHQPKFAKVHSFIAFCHAVALSSCVVRVRPLLSERTVRRPPSPLSSAAPSAATPTLAVRRAPAPCPTDPPPSALSTLMRHCRAHPHRRRQQPPPSARTPSDESFFVGSFQSV